MPIEKINGTVSQKQNKLNPNMKVDTIMFNLC